MQGIGFRPFISRLAEEYGMKGDICNRGSYVEIHAQGPAEKVRSFISDIPEKAPAVSAIVRMIAEDEAVCPDLEDFRILPSLFDKGEIFVSPDLATCPACRNELLSPGDRRYLHPFINCTDCGPRLTILDGMPYDRERTSMAEFPMCGECLEEYTSPESRRYHAQPVCCGDDGPRLFLAYAREESGVPDQVPRDPGINRMEDHRAGDEALIRYVRRVLREGGIAAVKGIGGFHLACDATSEAAVSRLRKLKKRPVKPFAVMARDPHAAGRYAVLPQGAEKLLDGTQKPILLLPKREMRGGETEALAPSVAPGNPSVGVMLPYTPLHMLLFEYPDGEDFPDVLVMTSGNPKGDPICRTTEEAVRYLAPMCDVILSHDRMIRIRADDTVMQIRNGKPYMIRRSRGYAPLPFTGPSHWKGEVLAVGGELKNTFCLAKDELWYPSPYVGDLFSLAASDALEASVERMERLLETKPSIAVCDLHPGYNSTAYAKGLPLPVLEVQHHYAHILSCMAENGIFDREVIGVSFDGTGYGTDGTVWGGEFLKAGTTSFERIGSLTPFLLAGGDSAAREGWRPACALLLDVCGSREEALGLAKMLHLADDTALAAQFTMIEGRWNAAVTTSAGRLFDAVSAILGICRASTFEGEASMALEFAAEEWMKRQEDEGTGRPEEVSGRFSGLLSDEEFVKDGFFLLPAVPFIRKLLKERESGTESGALAYAFHRWLAEGIAAGCRAARDRTGLDTAALSGGVFQNLLLLDLAEKRLEKDGFSVLTHSLVPPNDGGISLGQALYGMAYLNQNR